MSDELNCVDAAMLHDFAETIGVKQTRAWERVRRAIHAEAVRITDEWDERDHWVRREIDTSAMLPGNMPLTEAWWPRSTIVEDAQAWGEYMEGRAEAFRFEVEVGVPEMEWPGAHYRNDPQAVVRELHRRALEYARAMQEAVPVIYAEVERLLGVQVISGGEREMYCCEGGSYEALANRSVNTLVGLDRPGGWESAEVARTVETISKTIPRGVHILVKEAYERALDPNRLAFTALHESAEALLSEIETVAGDFAWCVTGIDDLRFIRAQSFERYIDMYPDLRAEQVTRVAEVRAEFERLRQECGW